ncbi:MAG: DEAD/DEAH box helicase [Phycisphaerales bacterium]|nr:DEAD/DEAH box helicase [Phycisphaerales bacterium]
MTLDDSTRSGFSELGIGPRLIDNLRREGVRRPRDVQAQVIPAILEGRDVLALASTGSGKTLAWAVPIAQQLLEDKPAKGTRMSPTERLRCIALVPTRELAEQVGKVVAGLIRDTVLRSTAVWGKVSMGQQAEAIERGVDILVGTPGRLRELVEAGVLDPSEAGVFVVDEADRLLDMGFRPQIRWLVERLPRRSRTLLLSATMPAEVESLAQDLLKGAIRLEVHPNTHAVGHVRHHMVEVHPGDRVDLLLHLISAGQLRKALIFCRTRRRTGWVATALRRNGVTVGQLHGDRSQAQRRRALAAFAEGDLDVLVATDVASRGLHIPGVRHVVNYDLPNGAEDLVHRSGRAAHGSKAPGVAWTFIAEGERGDWRKMASDARVVARPESVEGFKPAGRPVGAKAKRAGSSSTARASKGKSKRGGDTERLPGWLQDELKGKRAGGKRRVGPGRRKSASSRVNPKDKPGRGIVRPEE